MGDYKYDWLAFISYKHDDIEWAKWLQDKLEKYKLPSYLNEDYPGIRKDLRPIFRDETDLRLGYLTENIISALTCSKYLIIICSPTTQDSEYVKEEVQEFINLGRESMIIPFIVQGKPEECLPSPILKLPQIPLGANVNEISKDYAAIKVIAKLLGNIDIDKLWNRHLKAEEEEREKLLADKRRLQMVQSRFLAKEAEKLINIGDTCMASMLLLYALPKDPYDQTDRPMTKEALEALRNVVYHERSGHPYLTSWFSSPISAYDISPTGEFAAVGLFSEVFFLMPILSVINLITGERFDIGISSNGFSYGVDTVHFSLDGTYLLGAYCSDNFKIWDTKTWRAKSFKLNSYISSFHFATWVGATNVLAIAGSNIANEDYHTILLLNIDNNILQCSPFNGQGFVKCIVSSHDGKHIAYNTNDNLSVIDIDNRQHFDISLPKTNIHYLFNPSNSNELVILSKDEHKLFSFNIRSKTVEQISGNDEHAKTFTFTKDGNFMAWGSDNGVCRLNLKTNLIEWPEINPEGGVICMALSWDGIYIAFATPTGVYCYNCHTRHMWRAIDFEGQDASSIKLKFLADTYKLSLVYYDRSSSEYVFNVLDLLYLFELTATNIKCIELSNDCRYLAYYNEDKELYVTDIPAMCTKRLKMTCSNLYTLTRPLLFSNDNIYLAALCYDGTITVFNLESGEEYHSNIIKESGCSDSIQFDFTRFDELMVFIDYQTKIAFIVDEYVCVWDFITNVQLTNKLEFRPEYVSYNNSNNTLIITGRGHYIWIWDLTDNHLFNRETTCHAFDGKHIVLSNENGNQLQIVNIDTNSIHYVESSQHIRSMAISSDGKYLAMEDFSTYPNIVILDLDTHENNTLEAYTDSAICMFVNIYFEKDSHVLVSVCDTRITRWHLDTEEKEVYNNAQWVCANGKSHIKIVLKDGMVQLINHLSDSELIHTFNKRFKSRSFSNLEKMKYYLID